MKKFEYKKEIIVIQDPKDCEIIDSMNDIYGEDGWEIFSVNEKIIEECSIFGEPHKNVEYNMYMKREK